MNLYLWDKTFLWLYTQLRNRGKWFLILISFIEIFKFWVHIMIFIVSWPQFALRAAGDGVLKSTRRTIFVHPPLFLKTETKIFPQKSPSPIQMIIQEHNHCQEPWGPKYWQFDHALGSAMNSNGMNWIRIRDKSGYQSRWIFGKKLQKLQHIFLDWKWPPSPLEGGINMP